LNRLPSTPLKLPTRRQAALRAFQRWQRQALSARQLLANPKINSSNRKKKINGK
jgi:hypothetical protein